MTEHAIQLRRAWEACWPDGGVTRLDLPGATPTGARLTRGFNRPPLESGREVLWLRLEDVAGLLSLSLSGRAFPWEPGSSEGLIRLPPGSLEPRGNRLELLVGPEAVLTDGRPWGRIALVIRPADLASPPSIG